MQFTNIPEPLRALRSQLDQYRGIGKRAVFPAALKQQAVGLLEHHSTSNVVKALGVSPTSLSRWKAQLDQASPGSNAPLFVELPNTTMKNNRFPVSITLKQENHDQQITLQSDITLQQWHDIVKAITAEVIV